MLPKLASFIETRAKIAGKIVPARLQAALALLERLRDMPSLKLSDHRAQGSAGALSHETYGNRAHERFQLQPINKNHGRRSSNLPEWGQELLDIIASAGFEKANPEQREKIISEAQTILAKPLREIIEQEPLEVRLKGRTIENVIHGLLLEAEEKRKSGDVAQFLVGAKLSLRFKRAFPVQPSNKSDRKSLFDPKAKLGDFEIENAVIEVAVGPAEEKHIEQIAQILEQSESEVWLLTRSDRVAGWKNEIKASQDIDSKRVVVTSVEAFIGQNITELAEFSAKGKAAQLMALFDLYNNTWVKQVGTPGIRIVLK
jgi:hypothetical protein